MASWRGSVCMKVGNMNKDLTILVDRLKRIFPHLKMYNEGHYFPDDSPHKSGKQSKAEQAKYDMDFAPPVDLDWFAVIAELEKNGLTIANKKDVGNKVVTNKRVTNPDYADLRMEMDCANCGKETMSTITGRHERDSTYEMITCTECGFFSIGGEEQEDPSKYRNS